MTGVSIWMTMEFDSPVPPGIVLDGDGGHTRDELDRPRDGGFQPERQRQTGHAEPVIEELMLSRIEYGRPEAHHDLSKKDDALQ